MKQGPKVKWSASERRRYAAAYPHHLRHELLRMFPRRTWQALKQEARQGRLRKTAETMQRARQRSGDVVRRSGIGTRFRKGNMPATWVPVGTLIAIRGGGSDGYLKRKVAESQGPGLSRFGWKFEHVRVWEGKHGPVPPGHCVVFRDGNKKNCRLRNLKLITQRQNMVRNQVHHRWPPDLKAALYAKIRLSRVIGEKERAHRQRQQKSAAPARGHVRAAGPPANRRRQ